VVLELADPLGPWGVRGMAEMPLIPYAPAVVAALHDATGVWFDAFPLTPDRVVAGLRSAGIGRRRLADEGRLSPRAGGPAPPGRGGRRRGRRRRAGRR
jgi:hypothetical protein